MTFIFLNKKKFDLFFNIIFFLKSYWLIKLSTYIKLRKYNVYLILIYVYFIIIWLLIKELIIWALIVNFTLNSQKIAIEYRWLIFVKIFSEHKILTTSFQSIYYQKYSWVFSKTPYIQTTHWNVSNDDNDD